MKLLYTFDMVDMGDEIIAVPVNENVKNLRGVIKVNSEGREIMELLKNDITQEQIVYALAAKYETDCATLYKYVDEFIESLRKMGVLA